MTERYERLVLRGGTNASGTAEAWATKNPVLECGEPGFEVDTGNVKIGDGVRAWVDLPYSALAEAGLNAAYAGRRAALAEAILRQIPREKDVYELSPEVLTVSGVITGHGPAATQPFTNAILYSPARTTRGGTVVDTERDPFFYYAGGAPGCLQYNTSGNYPDQYYAQSAWLTGGGSGINGFAPWTPRPRFILYSTTGEFAVQVKAQGTQQAYRLIIDGKRVTEGLQTVTATGLSAGNGFAIHVTGLSAGCHVIELELSGNSVNIGSPVAFGGVWIGPNDAITRAAAGRFKVLCLGPSTWAGDNNNVPRQDAWISRLANLIGSDEHVNQSIGGTGVVNPGGYVGTYGSATYGDRIAPDVNPVGAHVIFYGDPYNDADTTADVQTQATADLNALRTANPTAIILAVGCYTNAGTVSSQQAAASAAIEAAAAAANVPYIDYGDYTGLTDAAAAWAASTAYMRGDVVNNAGTVYVCTVPHTSAATFDATKFVSVNWASTAAVANLVTGAVHESAAGMKWITRWFKKATIDALHQVSVAG